jgi:hypothetical protein
MEEEIFPEKAETSTKSTSTFFPFFSCQSKTLTILLWLTKVLAIASRDQITLKTHGSGTKASIRTFFLLHIADRAPLDELPHTLRRPSGTPVAPSPAEVAEPLDSET